MSTSNRIIIIGAGLGGLNLANGLKKANIPFTIFERDPSSIFRPQGYRVRINPQGASALQANTSLHIFSLFEATCADIEIGVTFFNAADTSINQERGNAFHAGAMTRRWDATKKPYTVDRTLVRHVLLSRLVEGEEVVWGKEFVFYEEFPDRVVVTFADGTTAEGKLLVGADGSRSKVRRQFLPGHRLRDAGGRAIYGKTLITPELTARFPAEAMKHMSLITDQHQLPLTLFLEPILFTWNREGADDILLEDVPKPEDYVYWVLFGRKERFGRLTDKELFSLSREESAKYSLELTEHFDPAARSLLELQVVGQASPLGIWSMGAEMPVWETTGRVTLIGDAIHAMPPTAGVGANTALKDAATLVRCLIEEGGLGKLKEAVGKYEQEMREYAKQAIESSFEGGKFMMDMKPWQECEVLDI